MLVVVACGSKQDHKPPDHPPPLPSGPVAVSLPKAEPAQLRTLTSAVGFVTIDAHGAIGWGRPKPGPAPFETVPLPRLSSPFAAIDPKDADPTAWVRGDADLEYELDPYATLSREKETDALVLADASSPARIAVRHAINHFGDRRVAIAAGTANTAVLYQFGGDPWQSPDDNPDLTLRTDQLDKLAGQHPHRVMLEYTDATTIGELVAALAAVAQTGAANVRLHRMMGWGAIGPSEIVSAKGSTSEDDVITDGEPATVTIDAVRAGGAPAAQGIGTSLMSWAPRFRYCFEKRGALARPGKYELAFDVSADGAISSAAAKGSDRAIESCVAGAVFDLEILPRDLQGPTHVTATIAFARGESAVAAEPEAPSGFYCWTHEDGKSGACAREQAQCEALVTGFNDTANKLGDKPSTNTCTAQKTAWRLASTQRDYPTRALCMAGIEKGDSCKLVR